MLTHNDQNIKNFSDIRIHVLLCQFINYEDLMVTLITSLISV